MTQQPSGPTGRGGDEQRGTRSDVDDLCITPQAAGPGGTEETTSSGGDPGAARVVDSEEDQ